MSSKLINAVQRYENFFREVEGSSIVWALARGNQLAIWSDEEGFILPVWSNGQQAKLGLRAFPTYETRSYSLSEFVNEVLPQLDEDQIMIGVNLDETLGGVDVSCAEFKRLLSAGDAQQNVGPEPPPASFSSN